MSINFNKIGLIAQYFAENTDGLYVTKLFKLFYYLDFISYNQRGASITGDMYYKLPYGPVPTAIKNEIDLMVDGDVISDEYQSQLKKFIGLKPDKDNNGRMIVSVKNRFSLEKHLSEYELGLVQKVAEVFKDIRAKAISNKTHEEQPWKLTSLNSIINYDLAYRLDIKSILPQR